MAMHLAAMWKVPQVVLFGPTNPFHWRPLHERAVVLVGGQEGSVTAFEPRMKGGEMGQITVKSVESAVSALLDG
jgi:ADP-heptose:LPS heptosyltransferase